MSTNSKDLLEGFYRRDFASVKFYRKEEVRTMEDHQVCQVKGY